MGQYRRSFSTIDDVLTPLKSEAYATTLSTFKLLKTLKVEIELNSDTSNFLMSSVEDIGWGRSGPCLNLELGREVTLGLWRSFFIDDPYAWLTELTVRFTRLQCYDRIDFVELEFPIKIKRHERDDAPSPLDNGFTLDSPRKWLERTWGDGSAG